MFFEHLLYAKHWMLNGHIKANNMISIYEEIKHSQGTQFVGILYKKEQNK